MNSDQALVNYLLSIVSAIHGGGKDVIGERWMLYERMATLSRNGGVAAVAEYFLACLEDPRGKRVAKRLRDAGRKTLEDEADRFLSGVGRVLLTAKLRYEPVRDANHRERLSGAFARLEARPIVASGVGVALRERLQTTDRKCPERLQPISPIFIRRSPPAMENIQHYLEEAATCYLLGKFEAGAVVARTTLELVLQDHLSAKGWRLAPASGNSDTLDSLIREGLTRGILSGNQEASAHMVKSTGNNAAHGKQVNEARTRSSLKALRTLVEGLYG